MPSKSRVFQVMFVTGAETVKAKERDEGARREEK